MTWVGYRNNNKLRSKTMDDSLYSFDKYKGFHIFIEDTRGDDYPFYEGIVQLNGTTFESGKALNPEKLLTSLKNKVEAVITYEAKQAEDL